MLQGAARGGWSRAVSCPAGTWISKPPTIPPGLCCSIFHILVISLCCDFHLTQLLFSPWEPLWHQYPCPWQPSWGQGVAWGQVAWLGKQKGAEQGTGIAGALVPSTWCWARATSTNILGAESLTTCSRHATAFVALEEHGVTSFFSAPSPALRDQFIRGRWVIAPA